MPLVVVVAPDKFRGSLSAPEAASAIARGVARADPGATLDLAPMADGGEGTVEALVAATSGAFRTETVPGPWGEPVAARYGTLGDGRTAVIEMAAASGQALVPPDRRDPTRTSTEGTGHLLRAAVAAGATRLVLGIGGSATNDGGAGLARALGYRLLDADGRDLPPGGGALVHLDRIDPSGRFAGLDRVEIAVACDVDNPLCGPRGASAVFGPQKGATPAQVEQLDRGLARLAAVIRRDLGADVAELPGAGAAGGLGAGLVAFAGGRLTRGAETVIAAVGLRDRLARADLAIVAEGMVDRSSAGGKTAVGVARAARAAGRPVLLLAGSIGPGADEVLAEGVDAMFSLCPGPVSLEEAVGRAGVYLEAAAEQAVRAFLSGRRSGGVR